MMNVFLKLCSLALAGLLLGGLFAAALNGGAPWVAFAALLLYATFAATVWRSATWRTWPWEK